MLKPTVYLETSVISYLTAWLSRDIVMAANQQITQDWWDNYRVCYDLYISQSVLQEASAGDSQAAERRLQALATLQILETTPEAVRLARVLIDQTLLPTRAGVDALHIAIAAVSGIDYLLTWNCRHIANAVIRPRVEAVCREQGYEPRLSAHRMN